MLSDQKPDIVIGTETWLKDDIKNTELGLNDYEIYRKDRPMDGTKGKTNHGGAI